MASIIEAFDNTAKESFAGIKILIWAVPVCMCYSLVKSNNPCGLLVSVIIGILYFGYLTQSCNNMIKKQAVILPGINVLKYGLQGLIACLLMLPYTIVGWVVWHFISSVDLPNDVWIAAIKVIGAFFVASIVITAHCLYVRDLNPVSVFNIRRYFIGIFEVFMSVSYLVIKLVLWSVLLIGLSYYIFSMFLGFDNVLWSYLLSVFFVFYSVLGANYITQTNDEVYIFVDKKERMQKEKEAIDNFKE